MAWAAAAVVFGGSPHLFAVAPWVAFAVLGIALWRIAGAARSWPLPSAWVRIPVTLVGLAAVLFSYRSVSGIEAGSALLLVMAALKLLETRSERDRILVVFISYFLLFAVFLRDQALWSTAWLCIGLIGITTALIQTVRRGPLLPVADAIGLSVRLGLQSVPLALVLFVLFPRIPGPFWGMPEARATGVSGLAEEVSPGDITDLTLSDEVAFRVRFEGSAPPPGLLYWRGPVLERFDGRTWRSASPSRAEQVPSSPPVRSSDVAVVGYQMVLEPMNTRWLLALETPLQWSLPHATLSPAGQLLSARPVHERLTYRARSAPAPSRRSPADDGILRVNLLLPERTNPRTVALAGEIRARARNDIEFIAGLQALFADGRFSYTLSPPPLGAHPTDEFLFRTRAGFCEHFASATAVLLRAGGIPARVVVGYQGAEANPFGDYWIVRQANAHAWVEAWIGGMWQRIDPTAAVAPERIEQGFAGTFASTERVTDRLWRINPWVNGLTLSWDAVNAAWDRWVLAYGPEMQEGLLSALGFEVPRAMQLAVLSGVATSICLLLLGVALHERRLHRRDPVSRIYREFTDQLLKAVRPRGPAETAEHYARAMATARPDLAPQIGRITRLYLQLRYGGCTDPARLAEFRSAVRGFRVAVVR